jgi:hypothetical protein
MDLGAGSRELEPKLTVDVLHVASQRKPVGFDQQSFFGMDANGNSIDPNPFYGRATRYQPPMAVRVGVEVAF